MPTAGQAARRRWRSARIWIVLAALLVLVALPSILRQGPTGQQLGVESAAPAGGRAVAQVLGNRGIAVHAAGSLPQALALAEAHPEAPVLFHDPAGYLSDEGLRELAAAVAPSRRVLVEPGFTALDALAPSVSQAGQVPDGDPLPAGVGCPLPVGGEAGTVAAEGRSYRSGPDGAGCFPVPGTDTGAAGAAHSVVGTHDGTVVLGNHRALANDGVDDEGHAVLSLWTLGRAADVVWYLPGLDDVAVDGGTPTPDQLLPDWVRPAGLWLIVCLVVLLLWKGRRHGPLAMEPLPVIVPASEAAIGRARLYERSGQHGAAARSLRSATLVRLSTALRLGAGASVEAVIAASARTTGWSPSRVAAALETGHVGSGRDLVAAATTLQDLEDAVQASLDPSTDTASDPARASPPNTPGPDAGPPVPAGPDERTP